MLHPLVRGGGAHSSAKLGGGTVPIPTRDIHWGALNTVYQYFMVKSNNRRDSCALMHRWGLFSVSGRERLSKRVGQITNRVQS